MYSLKINETLSRCKYAVNYLECDSFLDSIYGNKCVTTKCAGKRRPHKRPFQKSRSNLDSIYGNNFV